jgi:hypothetical protein
MSVIKTPITDLFGIKHPFILAGMNVASGPELAAAVASAGGLNVWWSWVYTEDLAEAGACIGFGEFDPTELKVRRWKELRIALRTRTLPLESILRYLQLVVVLGRCCQFSGFRLIV